LIALLDGGIFEYEEKTLGLERPGPTKIANESNGKTHREIPSDQRHCGEAITTMDLINPSIDSCRHVS